MSSKQRTTKKAIKQETPPPPPNTPTQQRLALTHDDDNDNHLEEEEQIEQGPFEWGFTHTTDPRYTAPTRASRTRAFGPRPGIGSKDAEAGLYALVSSKHNRDIVRRNNFMPGQFDVWNAKKTGGNNKYWGGYEDIDGDDVSEFVVKRENQDGPLVAVNGYTTKKSDWLARDKFFQTHPTRDQRKGQSIKKYMRDDIWKPTYGANHMDINRYSISEQDERVFSNSKYNSYKPTEKSPYRALGEHIVFPAIKAALFNIGHKTEMGAKLARQAIVHALGTTAFEAKYLSTIYEHMVKGPVIDYLQEHGLWNDFVNKWKELRRTKYNNDWSGLDYTDSEQYKDFDKWLFSKKDIKSMVKDFVSQYLTDERIKQMKVFLTTKIIEAIEHDVPDIDNAIQQRVGEYMRTTRESNQRFNQAWQ